MMRFHKQKWLVWQVFALLSFCYGMGVSELLAEEPEALTSMVTIVDGDTLQLGDGSFVRLLGIQAPEMGIKKGKKEPLADEATEFLHSVIGSQPVTFRFDSRRKDRFGRWLAHAYLPDGTWLQKAMLSAGMAHVYSFADNRAHIMELLAVEENARTAKRGLWSHPYYAVLHHAQAGKHLGRFRLVQGRLVDHAHIKGRDYLNFDEDWRTDFTASLGKKNRHAFKGYDWPEAGECVRVRGWLHEKNGAAIHLTHPEQIERLSPSSC